MALGSSVPRRRLCQVRHSQLDCDSTSDLLSTLIGKALGSFNKDFTAGQNMS